MKAKLEFDLNDPYDKSEHRRCVNSTNAYLALREISDKVFRPARKHGYGIVELDNVDEDIIGKLEEIFIDILTEYDINFNDIT